MAKALIRLAYKQVIAATIGGDFERNVFDTTYQEFLLKAQVYNTGGKFKTFTQLKANDNRANSLHYKLSFTTIDLISGLSSKIPQLKDNMNNPLLFEQHKFELIESHITDRGAHKVAITYYTGMLTLFNTMGEYMTLGAGNIMTEDLTETFTIKMQPNLAVVNYREIERDNVIVMPNEQLLVPLKK
jgi:hypothetical protein